MTEKQIAEGECPSYLIEVFPHHSCLPALPVWESYTDPWESTEAIHGPLCATLHDAQVAAWDEGYNLSIHCDEMGIHGDARLDYQQRLYERHC